MTRTSVLITLLAADAGKFAVLQHTQQPHLRLQRHLADLVQKKRAAVRLFESALTLRCVRR